MVEKMNKIESNEQLDLKNDSEIKFLEGRKDQVNKVFENEEGKSKLGEIMESFNTSKNEQEYEVNSLE
ncbi:MAG: hypothetical protein V3575_01685 [Candidatus Absconditabacteria bacterium]